MFAWWRKRRRNRISNQPFPADWEEFLLGHVAQLRSLSADQFSRLKKWMQVFIAEKFWEGCDGLVVTPEMKATIAAQAGLMVLGWDDYYFDHLRTILIYPQTVYRRDLTPKGGVVSEGVFGRLGEALMSGPVSLVWPHVVAGGFHGDDGQNVVFHEFAHVLDAEDLFYDGTPRLNSRELFDRWKVVLHQEFERHTDRVRHHRSTLIAPYGATNVAEFFAVSVECFFEQAEDMASVHPEWFELLQTYFRLDPREVFA